MPALINGYLDAEEDIRQRASAIGKKAIELGHYGTKAIAVPVVVPYPVEVTRDHVDIAVGMDGQGTLQLIRCPAPVFEHHAGTIKVWIEQENDAKLRSLDENAEMQKQAQRSHELAILKELMTRYPAEADLLSAGGE